MHFRILMGRSARGKGMKVIRLGEQWAIRSDYYSPKLYQAARSVPGMKNLGGNAWGGFRDAVELCASRLAEMGITCNTAALDTQDDVTTYPPILAKGIRDYQKGGVRFLLDRKRAILADTMGLGKSCTALTAARAMSGKTLIVCPSYVRGVWWNPSTGGEIKKWWPSHGSKAFLPAGTKASSIPVEPDTQVVVIHYDILHAWVDSLISWGFRTFIIDEAHALMSEGSRRSVAVKALAASCEFVFALTGTPLTNRPRDLWNVVDTVTPGRFGSFFEYGLRYCDAHKEAVTPTKTVWKFDGSSNLEELNKRLRGFMLRRTVADVGLQLPPKTRQIISVDVPSRAHLMPDAGAKAMRVSLDRAADAKMPEAVLLILSHVEAGHRVIAFAHRRSVAEFLANSIREHGFGAELVHGGVSALRRGAALERAKSSKASGEGHLLACTIDSCSTGIDLSYADVSVFVELVYEPQELLQAEARLHRFGQDAPVLIQYVIARGTTDELIAAKVVSKLDVYEVAIGKTGETLGGDLRGKPEDILGELYAMIETQKKLEPKKRNPAVRA